MYLTNVLTALITLVFVILAVVAQEVAIGLSGAAAVFTNANGVNIYYTDATKFLTLLKYKDEASNAINVTISTPPAVNVGTY
jgi:hypothetical protein